MNIHSPVARSTESSSGEELMSELVDAYDWARTPLGPKSEWPQSLKTVVRILLTSRYAMWMGWGPDLTFLYNDTYGRVTLGKKHPWALGRPAREVWSEIWDEIGPRIQRVLDTGVATWDESLILFLERNGYPEETYHTFSYSPLHDDDGRVAGMFCVVTEETERVIGERRLRLLRLLAAELGAAIAETDLLAAVGRSLTQNDNDLPFTLLYLEAEGGRSRLSSATGIQPGHPAAPEWIDAAHASTSVWPFHEALERREPVVLDDLKVRFPDLPSGTWQEAPSRAVVVPLLRQQQETAIGFLVVGLNPFRQFDTDYQGFVELIAGQIVAGISNARAFEEERRRAEALAEIDRAKTVFFTNISHEFRTPLTLMLGPLEEMSSEHSGRTSMSPEDRAQLSLIYRNAGRLLKLVNALLDFSRIEAGHASASYRPVDLAQFTRDLASAFRAATDKAGLQLLVECELTRGPVAVDQEMWEKIVLNLISNAFKFTFKGHIRVALSEDLAANSVRLAVSDTGIGIRREELPHLFERFHRVEDAAGRSFEGTGIGLALVKELVALHDGVISVESEEGKGSTFTVVIPRRSDRLTSAVSSDSSPRTSHPPAIDYVEQALRWLPSALETSEASSHSPSNSLNSRAAENGAPRPRVLLADDNADMRAYLSRLLGQHYDVLAVTNGREALSEALAHPPDLVLTDVMMPELDGFGLLQKLRSEPATRTVPVIMLSARAGEEANVGGLQAGADDYLIKPFSARELLARVSTQLQLRQRLAQFETLVKQAPIGIFVVDSTFHICQVNPVARPVFGDLPGLIGRDLGEVMRILWRPEYAEEIVQIFRRTLETGEPYSTPNRTEYRIDRRQPEYYEWRADRIAMPDGGYGVVCYFRDISMQIKTEEALRKTEKLAAVGRLASTISHEINNPLESVTNLLYIVRNLSTEQPVQQYILTAERELHRASEVVRHSLKFHRQATKPQQELVSELLQSTLTVYETRFSQADMEIRTEFHDQTPVFCFGGELRQVFANLIGNAFDAMRAGRALTLRTRNAVEPRTGERGIRVTIADNGSGMSAETQRRLFEPFFTTKGIHGTGLGLWVSSEILRRHRAELRLKSSQHGPRTGTVFTLFLPAEGPLLDSSEAWLNANPSS